MSRPSRRCPAFKIASSQAPPARVRTPNRGRQWLPVCGSLLLLLAANLYLFRDHWRGSTSFTFDFPSAYYASTAYWISSVQSGEWPHWIPFESMGYPASLNPQLSLYYPLFWLLVVLRVPYTLHIANVFQVIHILAGAVGFCLLARRLFPRWLVAAAGGLSFGLLGCFFSNAEHPDIIRAFSWLPWLFLLLLPRESTGSVTAGSLSLPTRLGKLNLLLPLAVAWYVCGAYPGLIVSGLVMCAVFIALQAAVLSRTGSRAVAIRDALIACGLIGLGLVMAAVLILPTSALSAELFRTHTVFVIGRFYLSAVDLLNLVYPSNLIHAGDYAMKAMQIPFVMLLFLPLALFGSLRRLIPFYGAAGLAAVMCLAPMRAVPETLMHWIPPLGYSRFPSGDYRIFLAIGVLFAALSGFHALLESTRRDVWRNVALLQGALALTALPSLHLLAVLDPVRSNALARVNFAFVLAGVAMIGACAVWVLRPRLRPACAPVLLLLIGICGVINARQLEPYWSDPHIEERFYGPGGARLMTGGRLNVRNIFLRHEASRPARVPPDGVLNRSWLGYVEGRYTINDSVKSISRQRAAASPELTSAILQPSTLYAIPCASGVCGPGEPGPVSLTAQALHPGRAIAYERNHIVYDLSMDVPSLVVENELFAPGWTGRCETHGRALAPVRVDGALRGWVLPGGHHKLRLDYFTPRLIAGGLVSALGYLMWGGLLCFVRFRPDSA